MRFIRLNGGPVLNGCNMNRCYITRFGCQWLVPPAQSTCEVWATPCWPENRAEPLQGSSFLENLKGQHLWIDVQVSTALMLYLERVFPACLMFPNHVSKGIGWRQHDIKFLLLRRIIRPKDCNSWMGWLRSTVPNSSTPKLHSEKDQRENYQVVWKTEATFRPTWLVPESIINSVQSQLLTDFVSWFFQASNEIQAVLQAFPKHSLIAAAWLK